MLPKRTFWEKATAVHVYCVQGIEGDRISRHWYDLVHLDAKGYAAQAIADKPLAKEVADWKSKFYRERDREGAWVDYHAVVSSKLQLVPDAETRKELEADYAKMAEAGLLPEDAETFDELMKRCKALQAQVNAGQ
jgi:hypothetical protein